MRYRVTLPVAVFIDVKAAITEHQPVAGAGPVAERRQQPRVPLGAGLEDHVRWWPHVGPRLGRGLYLERMDPERVGDHRYLEALGHHAATRVDLCAAAQPGD